MSGGGAAGERPEGTKAADLKLVKAAGLGWLVQGESAKELKRLQECGRHQGGRTRAESDDVIDMWRTGAEVSGRPPQWR
jgi:hypothetical protein